MRWLVASLALSTSLLAAETESLVVSLNGSQSVQLEGLYRVLTANSKIAKVRALPPRTLVITGVKSGETTVRAWFGKDKEREFLVSVVPTASKRALGSEGRQGVIRVSLEFLETSFSLGKNIGVHWPETLQFSGAGILAGSANTSGLNYTVNFSTAQGWIDHMVKEGFAKILANPELYVRLGEEANFHSGGEVPVTSSTESYGRHYRRVEWKPYGLTVKVRPQSIDEVHVSSDIHLEISELNPGLSTEGIPAINKRTLDTKINSIDGETVILSGLTRKSQHENETSVPILGSIPLIGLLFTNHRDSSEGSVILMAVTFSMSTRAREEKRRGEFDQKFSKRHYGG